ncbi:MAG TPA: hypothetical protein VEO02_13815 [Thermoanaerobaculia bacterium]|nr:hypothetical protein [Thermoanaerobaculia bacterium]
MARGWGRSEEDLGAEKEQAVEEKGAGSSVRRPDADATATRRRLEMTLARIEEQLAKKPSPVRRQDLETARSELLARLPSG